MHATHDRDQRPGRESPKLGVSVAATSAALLAAACLGLVLAAGGARGDDDDDDDDDGRRDRGRFCSETAVAQFVACEHEVQDDLFAAKAICLNVSDEETREDCFAEARSGAREGRSLCRAQRRARRDLCDALGEERYDPDFDPANFDDDFRNLTAPNPYFPIRIGNVWEFEASEETNTITVLDETKLIEGVTCIVVNDLVRVDGVPLEDTDDWYAQRRDGTVDYCGESVRDFETFEGDVPQIPELVSIDGSFKAGRDGDLSGTIFPASPAVGATYRQEWSAGNAEDAATVLATDYRFGRDPELDEFVPRALVELLCDAGDCVVTGEVTPIEPGLFDRKYYARGIGIFLEVNPASGEINQLVACNFDPRCASLPPR